MTTLFPLINEDVDSDISFNFSHSNLSDTFNENIIPSYTDEQIIDRTNRLNQLRMKESCILEICLSDIESVRQAIQGGANSVELCVDRNSGGITPSYGLIKQAVQLCSGSNVEVHVLVRPRVGFFTYTADEFDIILRDIIYCERTGVTGVVVGVLTEYGTVDVSRMKIIRKVAKNMKLTFHRAFDVCVESIPDSLEAILSIPCERLLTSGKEKSAEHGIKNLLMISQFVKNRIQVIAACGIKIKNVHKILTSMQSVHVHAGSAVMEMRHDSYLVHMRDRCSDFNGVGAEGGLWSERQSVGASKSHLLGSKIAVNNEFGSWEVVSAEKVSLLLVEVERARSEIIENLEASGVVGCAHSLSDGSSLENGIHRSNETVFHCNETSSRTVPDDSYSSISNAISI